MRNARGSGRSVGRLLAEVRCSGDVEMDPGHRHEFPQEESALDQTALDGAGVGEVGVPAVEILAVLLDHGQLPVALPCPLAGSGHGVIPGLRNAESPGHLVAQCPSHRAGQRGDVNKVRGPELLRVAHRVAQDQPALGIGIDDVHGLAVHGLDHVTRPGRVRTGHVLHGRGDGHQRRARGKPCNGGDGRDHGARTGLVHLHLFHLVRRLDADAAGVEADALAYESQPSTRGVLGPVLAGSEHDHPRRVVAAGSDGQKHAHAQLGGPGRFDDVDEETVALGKGTGLACQDLRRHVVGGAVVQAASQVCALPDDRATLGCSLQGRRVCPGRNENQLVERRRDALVVVAIDGGGLEFALHDATRQQLGGCRSSPIEPIAQLPEPDREGLDAPAGQTPLDGRADPQDHLARNRVGVACGNRQQPTGAQLSGGREDGPVPLGLQLAERGQRRQLPAGAPVDLREGAFESGLACERDGEHVRRNVPGLIDYDAQLHGEPSGRG